jgi:hypothetical protein
MLRNLKLFWLDLKNNIDSFDPLYFRQVYLLYSNPDDVEILKKLFTPLKLIFKIFWHKSNGGFERNNYFK